MRFKDKEGKPPLLILTLRNEEMSLATPLLARTPVLKQTYRNVIGVLGIIACMLFFSSSSSSSLRLGFQENSSFDLFLLAQSWQPEFCYKEPKYPGCNKDDYMGSHLALHGLWPQYTHETNGSEYPSFCKKSPVWNQTLVDQNDDFKNEMYKYWPNVKYLKSSSEYNEFWIHEWTKHGLCTSLTQLEYLSNALELEKSLGTPSLISDNVGRSIQYELLQKTYENGTAAIECKGAGFLTAVYTCWDKDDRGYPTSQIDCPESVMKELDTCNGKAIVIAALSI